jgi:L-threonylcarbamoyladenylate synthase
MRILSNNNVTIDNIIRECVDSLKKGELLILPSDTVYGLAVDATNEDAVKKLMHFKQRPAGKAISVYAVDRDSLTDIVECNKNQIEMIKKITPGPYTFVLPSKKKLVQLLESENGTQGVRLPNNIFIQLLVKTFGKPITSTSANISSRPSNYSVESLLNSLSKEKKEEIDLIVDFGQLPHNKPSTVIDLTTEKVTILRQGDESINKQVFYTRSAKETQNIAKNFFHSLKTTIKPIIILLQGELGVGKTLFVKSIGTELGINHIDSPSFIVYNEYILENKDFKILIHGDLYNIQDDEEFKNLGLEEYLNDHNLLCLEWGERAGKLYELFKEKAEVINIQMEYINEKERKISISSL